MLIDTLKSKIFVSDPFYKLLEYIKRKGNVYLENINGSLIDFSISFLTENKYKLIIVVPDRRRAEFLIDDLSLISDNGIDYFPPYGGLFTKDDTRNIYDKILRLKTLSNLTNNESSIVVTTGSALVHPIIGREDFLNINTTIHVNEEIDFQRFVQELSEKGFKREDFIDEAGDFAVRGGILDIFSLIYPDPVRIEFFGNIVESIRLFDINSQRSIKTIDTVKIVPPVNDITDSGSTIFDYLSGDFISFFVDDGLIRQKIEEYFERWRTSSDEYKSLREREFFKDLDNLYDFEKLISRLPGNSVITSGLTSLQKDETVGFDSRQTPIFKRSVKLLINNIIENTKPENSIHTYILCDNKGQKERLENLVFENDELTENCSIDILPLKKGFIYPDANLAIYTDFEIFERKLYRRSLLVPKTKAEFALKLNKLTTGDVVVHQDYGIGKFVGLKKISVGGIQQECLKIRYKDGDILYLNVDNLNFLEKFSGQEGITPALSKLGSSEWDKLKERTKRTIKNIARDLILLYAERKKQKGIEYSSDTFWQREMEASFVYEETEDQLNATQEVKKDMETTEPMDRLLCGDVGFGKTEVAIRASFKAVNDGKQVAVLVPTTILADQHYKTFIDRLGTYPVDIAVLSRFKTRSEQKKIVEELKKGKIDIVIGTHRLLSKDIHFKNLGLLIIDEEQRFGVRHKEKLKMIRREIDVLAMTATPIPRTLHLSLMGIRDYSTINTPPKNRLPIITDIIKFEDELIRDAIYREIDRGGQVYFVHNRVQTIEKVTAKLKKIVPGVKFEIAHGQMEEKKLENIMHSFLNKEFDVLVCTMIIEAGLDIPNVNTIIVDRADKFGLAQLYQLRGRVGRSDIQAFAYLVIPDWRSLTGDAAKRLKTISEHTELGAGFQIAMNDLEIRGAGNVFGAEQSGFINSIGYEMYQKILEQAVKELKAEIIPDYSEERIEEHIREVKINVNIEAYFPENYIENNEERVNFYKKLANIRNVIEIDDIKEELIDRFGRIPDEGNNLLNLIQIKLLAQKLGITNVTIDERCIKIKFFFDKDERLKNKDYIEKIISGFVDHCKYPFVFVQEAGLGIKIDISGGTKPGLIGEIKVILNNIYSEVKNEKAEAS